MLASTSAAVEQRLNRRVNADGSVTELPEAAKSTETVNRAFASAGQHIDTIIVEPDGTFLDEATHASSTDKSATGDSPAEATEASLVDEATGQQPGICKPCANAMCVSSPRFTCMGQGLCADQLGRQYNSFEHVNFFYSLQVCQAECEKFAACRGVNYDHYGTYAAATRHYCQLRMEPGVVLSQGGWFSKFNASNPGSGPMSSQQTAILRQRSAGTIHSNADCYSRNAFGMQSFGTQAFPTQQAFGTQAFPTQQAFGTQQFGTQPAFGTQQAFPTQAFPAQQAVGMQT